MVGKTATVHVKNTVDSATSAFEGTLTEANRRTNQAAKATPKNPWVNHPAVVFIMSYVNMWPLNGLSTPGKRV